MRRSSVAIIAALPLLAALPACESSGPSQRRDIEVVYRFENLRKTPGERGGGGLDEWAVVKPILDHASSRPVEVRQSERRTIGALELATYEARCTLPTVRDFEQVQSDLEALGAKDEHGERTEAFLSQIRATYRSNFVAATVNVAVSGVSVSGHRIRLWAHPNLPPSETTAGGGGIWVARLAVVPETRWVYGLSEDPRPASAGGIPTRYFRINVNTRKQERVEEPDFLGMFPAAMPGALTMGGTDRPRPRFESPDPAPAPAPPRSASALPAQTSKDRWVVEQRKREDEEFRKRIAQEDAAFQKRRTTQTASKDGN